MDTKIFTFDEYMNVYGGERWINEGTYNEYLNGRVKEIENLKTHNYPDCHCDNCIDAISEYHGYLKYGVYSYRGMLVWIKCFCPLDNCMDMYIGNKEYFYGWISLSEAKKMKFQGYFVYEKDILKVVI